MSTLSSIKPADLDMLAVKQPNPSRGISLHGRAKASEAQVDAVAQDFEAQFIAQMLQNMFSTMDAKESLGGNDAEEVYQTMMVDQYGKMIARTGGIGVADQVKRQILKLQEVK